MKLKDIPYRQKAVIKKMDHNENTHYRLVEMGIIEGEEIEKIRTSPFGDPSEYEILGYRVLLRDKDAENILVE